MKSSELTGSIHILLTVRISPPPNAINQKAYAALDVLAHLLEMHASHPVCTSITPSLVRMCEKCLYPRLSPHVAVSRHVQMKI